MWQKGTAVCRCKQISIVLARTKKAVGLVTQLYGDQFTSCYMAQTLGDEFTCSFL